MSPIPWSATRELKLRRHITLLWIGVWAGLLGGLFLLGAARTYPQLYAWAGMMWGAGLYLFYRLTLARAELGDEMCRLPGGSFHEGSGMLANKPRSTANLTRWIQWADAPCDERSLWFHCNACGKRHEWSAAQWIPNYDPQFDTEIGPGELRPEIDPGGGRFVILCRCGLGHFRLKS